MYNVIYKRKIARDLLKLPLSVRHKFLALQKDLAEKGPMQPDWMNFSKLSDTTYHCHLDYHHVACWRNNNGTIEIEVYYVGSRESAPY